jgi:hypothetical protein
VLYASIIDQIPSSKVIGAVNDYIAPGDQSFDVGVIYICYDGLNLNIRVDLADMGRARYRLWQAQLGVTLGKHGLALKI